jgi:hypothetical protein
MTKMGGGIHAKKKIVVTWKNRGVNHKNRKMRKTYAEKKIYK